MLLEVVQLAVLCRDDPVALLGLRRREVVEVLAGRLDLDGARDLHLPRVLLDRIAEAEVSHYHREGERAEGRG